MKKNRRPESVGLREILDSLDESRLREIAKINRISNHDGGAEAVREKLLAMARAQPVIMFSMVGVFSERIWTKIRTALEGTPQELLPEDWTSEVDADAAEKMFLLFQFFFLGVAFARVEGRKGAVRVTAATEALEYWRNGGAEVLLKLREFYSRCFQLAQAAANLYGIVSLTAFTDICRRYLGEDFKGMDAPEVMEIQLELRSRLECGNFRVVKGEIQHCDLHGEGKKIAILREAHARIDPWLPEEPDEFVRFADVGEFLKTPALAEYDALQAQGERSPLDDRILKTLDVGWRQGCGDDKVLRLSVFLLTSVGGVAEEAAVRVLSEVRNTTRTWEYFGNTAEELDCRRQVEPQRRMPPDAAAELMRNRPSPELMAEYGLAPSDVGSIMPKIGRNDPCPCGSGKKYKKCCGRV